MTTVIVTNEAVQVTQTVMEIVAYRPITLSELPKSTIKVERKSLRDMTLKDPDIFTEKKVIGQGTFGYGFALLCIIASINRQVYKAKLIETGEYFALKRIKMDQEKDGVGISTR